MNRWRTVNPASTRWAEWDGEYIAYHGPSGRSHLLNAASELLITRVLLEPRTAHEAAAELAGLQAVDASAEYTDSVAALLLRLDELGLIERAA